MRNGREESRHERRDGVSFACLVSSLASDGSRRSALGITYERVTGLLAKLWR
jgi:hypothetical protein